jgi:hypothetical protein
MILLAVPRLTVAPGLEPAFEVQRAAVASWESLESIFQEHALQPVPVPRIGVVIEKSRLEPGRGGTSELGRVLLRQLSPGAFTAAERAWLAHELAHQFLLQVCAPASADTLFHEAFALVTSGELEAWREGDYQSLSEAAKVLSASISLDSEKARRALARLLVESRGPDDRIPRVIARRLARCDGRSKWSPLIIDDLVALDRSSGDAAWLIMSRHSGEVLASAGDIGTARPFGSTLKPFLLAGAAATPSLTPRVGDQEWACGDGLPQTMRAPEAVLLSCNGYFLDWASQVPGVERFGAWGPVFLALGMSRLPEHMSEAIGLRSTLSLSPLSLAGAYRLLAEARPDLIALMRRNANEGTLAKLPQSEQLAQLATKTGTVRDGASRPLAGWLVGVVNDFVMVTVVPGRAPRQFPEEFMRLVDRANRLAARGPVEVQVFSLVSPGQVDVRCQGAGFAVTPSDGPVALSGDWARLADVLGKGKLVCLTAPFEVRVPKMSEGRPYAGIFRRDAPAPYVPPRGMMVSEAERRARTGSEGIFRTTRLLYVTGVLSSEDASILGEPRAALARVISHNVDTRERHGSRPVCDTTHCQVFQGTTRPTEKDAETLMRAPIGNAGWLPFSRGGDEPWAVTRPRKDVEKTLGLSLSSLVRLESRGGTLRIVRTTTDEGSTFEDAQESSCELLRGPLKLPSCPTRTTWSATRVEFSGVGRGHGLGLDVEAARRSRLDQDAILKSAFGAQSSRP